MVVSRDVGHARFSTMGCCWTPCSSLSDNFIRFPIISHKRRLRSRTQAAVSALRSRTLRFALEFRRRFLRSACATFRCAVNCDELPEYCAERLSAIMIYAKRLRAILIIIISYIIKLYYTFSYFGVTALHRHTYV